MITLESIKAHLRVESPIEDALIATYWEAAKDIVEKYLGDDMPDPVPAPIDAAVMLLVADLYENRTRQSEVVLSQNYTYRMLLNPYRSMTVAP